MSNANSFGTRYLLNKSCIFSVWAPLKESMTVHLLKSNRLLTMQKDKEGYFSLEVEHVDPSEQYVFSCVQGEQYPDPASHFQPEGVFGPSQVIDHTAFEWHDQNWKGISFEEIILYEIHVGTFTKQGTFEAIINVLDDLLDTGINAIQLMPVAQFPGERDWGYDATFPYAVQHSYGGPEGLKRLVNACHQKGIAVYLDVVYNHLGPEGNYLGAFAPYFTEYYKTPWGEAINFDGEWSDGVRNYFANNVLYWLDLYHIDGLRCDAIHTMYDTGAVHFWELVYHKMNAFKKRNGRLCYLIAESDLNSPRVISDPASGGWGFHAQWLDDFHHALYVILHPKGKDRYADFGRMEQLAKAYKEGFVHSGEYVEFRKRKYGASSHGIEGDHFVAFNLNHDQVGNRVRGERLSSLVDFDRLKIAAAALLLSPYVPMLFMGEEYGEDTPFFYFVNYATESLQNNVLEGRKKEFEKFSSEGEHEDPNSLETFNQSKLQWNKRNTGMYAVMHGWHKELIKWRKQSSVFRNYNKEDIGVEVIEEKGLVLLRRSKDRQELLLCLFNMSEEIISYQLPNELVEWTKILDSKEEKWNHQATDVNSPMPPVLLGGQTVELAKLSVSVYSLILH